MSAEGFESSLIFDIKDFLDLIEKTYRRIIVGLFLQGKEAGLPTLKEF